MPQRGFYADASMTTGTATSQLIWPQWNTMWINSGTTTATATTWGQWSTIWNSGSISLTAGTVREMARVSWGHFVTAHQETVEQREARAAAEAERQRVWEAGAAQRAIEQAERQRVYDAANAKRLAGHKRAMELLYLVLSTSQKRMLEEKKFFLVDAPSGRCYRIDQGNHQNVKVIDKATGNILEALCVQPDGLPDGDVMLIQKLLIETAEQAFRDTANISAWATGGVTSRSKHGTLTGEKLAELLQFPAGGRDALVEAAAVRAA